MYNRQTLMMHIFFDLCTPLVFGEIHILAQMLCWIQMYDETEHALGNDADVSGMNH
jgi:hypothetical protein